MNPFNQPFASQTIPGGLAANLLFGFAVDHGLNEGFIDRPIFTGRSDAFGAMRGLNYDKRQMAALQSAVSDQKNVLLNVGRGVAALGGREATPEMLAGLSNILDLSSPFVMDMVRRSPEFRKQLSTFSGGASPLITAAGMEGITRRQLDPVMGNVGMSVETSNAMGAAVRNMLTSGPTYGTTASGDRGAMLSRGASYGFSDIDTMYAMSGMLREGALPDASNVVSIMTDPTINRAIREDPEALRKFLRGRELTNRERQLIESGGAQESDFDDPSRVGMADVMLRDGVDLTDPKQLAEFEQALRDPSSELSKQVAGISAEQYASAAAKRLENLQAITEFLTSDEIQALGEDLADVSNAMLKQLSGGAVHQISSTQLSRNLREMKFAADRLGLSREQVQAIAGVSAQTAAQYGFQSADAGDFMRDHMSAMMQYNDMGMGGLAAAGVASYGADNQEQAAARSARGLASVRRSRNAKLTAALSILSTNAGVEFTEGGAAERLLRDIQAGEFSAESERLLSGTTDEIVSAITGSTTGIREDQIVSTMNNQHAVQEALNANERIVEANRQLAQKDVFSNVVGRQIANQMGAELTTFGGDRRQKDALAAAFSTALSEGIRMADPAAIRNVEGSGEFVASQLPAVRAAIKAQADAGNATAIEIMQLPEEQRDNEIRNMIAGTLRSVQGQMELPISGLVGAVGAKGNESRIQASAYQEVMADLSRFAAADKKYGMAKAIDIVTGAAGSGATLADFAQVAGVSLKGEVQTGLQELQNQAQISIDSIDKQLEGTTDEAAKRTLLARKMQYQRIIGKITEFNESGGAVEMSDADRGKIEAYLQTGGGLTPEVATRGASAASSIMGAIDAASDALNAPAVMGAEAGIKAAQAILGASTGDSAAVISSATVENIAMGSVTINVGDTVITSTSAEVIPGKGSRGAVTA